MAKTAPYYTGDNVPLGFEAFDGVEKLPISASEVLIRKPDATLTDLADATVTDSEVFYLVPSTVTADEGSYEAYFENTFQNGRIRTHMIPFHIVHNITAE